VSATESLNFERGATYVVYYNNTTNRVRFSKFLQGLECHVVVFEEVESNRMGDPGCSQSWLKQQYLASCFLLWTPTSKAN